MKLTKAQLKQAIEEEMGGSSKGITAQDIKKAPAMAELLKQSPEIMDAIEQAAKDPKVQAAVEQALAQADGLEEASFSADRRSMPNPRVADPSWSPTSRAARGHDKDDISAREVGRSIRQANDPVRQKQADLRSTAATQEVVAFLSGLGIASGVAATAAPTILASVMGAAAVTPAMIGLGVVGGPILAGAALLITAKLLMASDANKRAAREMGESKEHTMKLNKDTLAQMIKEELEVILTDEEAVEMFGLENMLTEESVDDMLSTAYGRLGKKYNKAGRPDSAEDDSKEDDDNDSLARKTLKGISQVGTGLEEEETNDSLIDVNLEENELDEGCPDAHKRDEEEPLEEADVTYVAKMLLNGLLALHKAGVQPGAIIDALRSAGERERGAMVGLPGFEELPPEVQGAVGGNVAQHDQARGLAEHRSGRHGTKPRMKENNLFMTRDKLAEMIRQEMTRTIRRNKENA